MLTSLCVKSLFVNWSNTTRFGAEPSCGAGLHHFWHKRSVAWCQGTPNPISAPWLFSVIMSHLEAFPSITFLQLCCTWECFHPQLFCKYVVLGSVSIHDLFIYYLLVVSGLNRLTHLFIVPLYLFTSVNSVS